jgi:hypothetical protein
MQMPGRRADLAAARGRHASGMDDRLDVTEAMASGHAGDRRA